MVRFVLQLSVILIFARLGGSLFARRLKLPRVLGELTTGILIGPYALGALPLPFLGPLFSLPTGPIPVSPELYALATLASIVLLFLAGLETDLATFLRYSFAGTLVGLCGVVFSFVLGDLCALWFGVAENFMDPPALFLGTISTATSVGITARILTERKKTQTPEGVTIMAAAVFDDVLGIILLAMVVGLTNYGYKGSSVPWSDIAIVAGKAFGFWITCTALGLLLAKRISRMLKLSHTPATIVALSLGLALLLAGLSEMAGLAMIIGAYIMGLSLSRTDLVGFLQDQLQPIYELLVPVFFCVMGMLVDVSAMSGLLVFGLAYSLLAILSKVAGCALPALFAGFNSRGAYRIGLGMLPRGEVALIIASVGLTAGTISKDIFGVAIMMTVVTTLLAPPFLIQAFKGRAGVRRELRPGEGATAQPLVLTFASTDIADFLLTRIIRAFRKEEFFVQYLPADNPTYQIRKEDLFFTLVHNGPEIQLMAAPDQRHIARLLVLEELVLLQDLLDSFRDMDNLADMQSELAKDLFDPP